VSRLRALGVALIAATCVVLLAAGCGGDRPATVTVADPAVAFAPVIHLSRDEPFMPMSARWFVRRSALWMAHGMGCSDGKVSVGRELRGQRNVVVNWIHMPAIGWGPTYWREAFRDSTCDRAREAYRYYVNQLTRPYDGTTGRAPGLRPEEGYYLDLMDWARPGRPAEVKDGQAAPAGGEMYVERSETDVDGEPGLRLTYWALYGMSRLAGPNGRPVGGISHEGDWERVQVLLREGDDSREWEPLSVRLSDSDGGWREVAWEKIRRIEGPGSGEATHPVLFAARASHTLYPRPGRHRRNTDPGDGAPVPIVDHASAPCRRCPRWETWQGLADTRQQDWYGFGGAWGDIGRTSFTTGPLGPHPTTWPAGDPGAQIARSEQRP
jgi:hypothetical protein